MANDPIIRKKLLQKLSRQLNPENHRIIEELGLEHGACRVDVAVVNGKIHGYEIKSDSDTLNRLPAQVDYYSKALDRSTLVVGERFYQKAKLIIPEWWGINTIRIGPKGGVYIETERVSKNNPNLSIYHMAHLLWRKELVEFLIYSGVEKKFLKGNRSELCNIFSQSADKKELSNFIRETVKRRKNWRDL